MTVHAPLTMTKEAFLAWIERREERYELAAGRVIMMVRTTRNHAQVVANLVFALKQRLTPERYDMATKAFAVHVGDSVRFPDILVEPAQEDGSALKAAAPILIAEVLSPGTLHVDFGEKKNEYFSLPTLQAYLVLAADEPRAWLWRRTDAIFPPDPEIIEGLDQQLALPTLGVDIPLGELYRGVH